MYGSGYASYVDVFLTWRDGSARRSDGGETWIQGIALGLCRLAPIATLFADALVSRSEDGSGSSYLPDVAMVAGNPIPGWEQPCREVTQVLDRHGITLLHPVLLSEQIDANVNVETNLADRPPYSVFDAWFHWMD